MPGVADQPPVKDSRNLYAFGATSFFNDTASEIAYWVLPAFLASIGAGPSRLSSWRSEEHTSELQSPDHLVCCLLLAKKDKKQTKRILRKIRKKSHHSS